MDSKILSREELNKITSIDKFIDESENGSVFASEWFTSLKKASRFLTCFQNDELVCIMPLFENSNNSKSINQSTMYIPYGGPVVKSVPREERNKIRFLREINAKIINTLKANFDNISFSTDPYFVDIMPYIRSGFMPELRYTYKLDITKPEKLFQNYGSDRKKEIRKAIKNDVKFNLDADIVLTDVSKYVEWESKYGFESSKDEVYEILSTAIKNDNGMCFVATLGDVVLGSVGMLWKNDIAYIMYSYFDKKYDLGTIPFLYDNIFKYLSKEKGVKVIDFEGSVYETVEAWNISFGAYQDRFYNLHFNKDGNDEIARSMYAYFEK